jgi:hypothetical protein
MHLESQEHDADVVTDFPSTHGKQENMIRCKRTEPPQAGLFLTEEFAY